MRIAIECNGVYWHSEAAGKGRSYHQKKHAACAEAGIQLFTVHEDDWRNKRAVVESMVAHKLGVSSAESIAARVTSAARLSTSEAQRFFTEHHLQGFAPGTHYLGLVHEGMTVAAMSLKATDATGRVLRLERYATSVRVPGGHSKLIRYAEREIPGWEELVTFADLEVSNGSLYEKTGWSYDGAIPPDYKYVVKGHREHKFGYRLARFRSDPNLVFEEGKTEQELAEMNKLWRVWDSGKVRYRYRRSLA